MLIYVYMLLTVIMGLSALFKGAIYPGIAGVVGPMLCWWAASGFKGSLIIGTSSQKLGGLIGATVYVAVGIGIVNHSGYWVWLFGYGFTGVTWCLVGLAAGWFGTTRRHAVTAMTPDAARSA